MADVVTGYRSREAALLSAIKELTESIPNRVADEGGQQNRILMVARAHNEELPGELEVLKNEKMAQACAIDMLQKEITALQTKLAELKTQIRHLINEATNAVGTTGRRGRKYRGTVNNQGVRTRASKRNR